MTTQARYVVRIIKDENQLTEAMKLRCRTYAKTYPKAVEHCTSGYESDEFDHRSIHLGLYYEVAGECTLAGYCRMILPPALAKDFEQWLITAHPLYPSAISSECDEDKLPIIKNLLDKEKQQTIISIVRDWENQNEAYAEMSRMIIDEEHRSLALATFFTESFYAVSQSIRVRQHLFVTDDQHTSFFSRFGLNLMEGMNNVEFKVWGNRHSCVNGSAFSPSLKYAASIRKLRAEFEAEMEATSEHKWMRAA